ncbi:hypothetical protein JQ596_00375 [Bradyrhizobium manausense]|uniref:hypothetical protein n=1 Tax=Bradyrhizobium TaxID=374 RepID=UPI001BA5D3E4|nr:MULTISPECIES: hypothetical protein [Bradyrhizobium]MBR0823968.1 hypothetical protein [Bradyrhizobium manausense]UVO26383.1 hypothetical protein KUF59_27980 [Bradyrhizobium arachidis]
MHIRAKAYLQLIARWRSARALLSRRQGAASRKASPALILAATTLALLLAILEIDLHAADLQSLGLLGHYVAIDPMLLSP